MIEGAIRNRRAFLVLPVRGPGGHGAEVEFTLDTGFTGMTTLSPAACENLGLPFLRVQPAGLADGTSVLLDVYEATVLWDGAERAVEALAMERQPLLGMTLLDGFDVRLRVRRGGFLRIEPSPEEG